MKTIYLLTCIAVTALISACGFQLKGQTQDAPKIHAIYLECDCDNILAESIFSGLQARNIQLISTPGSGLAVSISGASENTFNTAIGDNDRSKEVELTLGFSARLSRNGKLLDERRIESSAYVQYNSDTYLGSSSEAEETRARLRSENADKLIRYLSAAATQ